MNVYDFSVKARNGEEVSLSSFRGKVLLIVNTATGCGFTPQYTELEKLYKEFRERGFEILDFPCNQFGEQTPGTDEEVHTFCTGRFGITFPQYAKVEVTGAGAIPLYQWITENTKFEGFDGPKGLLLRPVVKKMDRDYRNNGSIKWNFTKILIDRSGDIIARYEPTTDIEKIRAKIQELL